MAKLAKKESTTSNKSNKSARSKKPAAITKAAKDKPIVRADSNKKVALKPKRSSTR